MTEKRSFKDGLTEQMNSFDECRLSPTSCPSEIGATGVVTDGKRPPPDISGIWESAISVSGYRRYS